MLFAHYLMLIVLCILFVSQCRLHKAHCYLLTKHYALHNAHCLVSNVE